MQAPGGFIGGSFVLHHGSHVSQPPVYDGGAPVPFGGIQGLQPPPTLQQQQQLPPQQNSTTKMVTVVKEGPLFLQEYSGWKKLYCYLYSDGRMLFFFKADSPSEEKVIVLNNTSVARLSEEIICIEHQGGEKTQINAFNSSSVKEWLHSIQEVINNLSKNMYPVDPQFNYGSIMHFPGPSAPPAYSNKLRTSEPGVSSASSGPPVYDNNMRRSSPVDHHTPQNMYGGFFSHVPQQSISPTQNYHVMMSVNSPPADTSTFTPTSPSNQWSDRYGSGQPQQQQQHVPIQQHTYPQVVLHKGSSETDLLPQARPHTAPLRHSAGSHTSPSSVARPRASTSVDEAEALRKEIEGLKLKNQELKEQLEKQIKESSRPTAHPATSSPKMEITNSKSTPIITIDTKKDPIEFHERLGGGGSGANVYRCTIKGFSFAAKVMDINYAQPCDIEHMMKEIIIMTELEHDNIVRYIGCDMNMTKKEIRMYMELYSGTLRDVMDSRTQHNKKLAKREIIAFSFQIVKGLHYLHSKNIIHRDLKSDNIFVTWDGQKNPKNMKIGDFDVSKVLDKSHNMNFTQNIGTQTNSAGFIAPEIMNPGNDTKPYAYGPEVDVWSFGMIMFEMLTMQRPYSDMNPFQVSEKNAQGVRPKLPDEVDSNQELKDLVKLFEKCTNKIPSKRPKTKKILAILSRM